MDGDYLRRVRVTDACLSVLWCPSIGGLRVHDRGPGACRGYEARAAGSGRVRWIRRTRACCGRLPFGWQDVAQFHWCAVDRCVAGGAHAHHMNGAGAGGRGPSWMHGCMEYVCVEWLWAIDGLTWHRREGPRVRGCDGARLMPALLPHRSQSEAAERGGANKADTTAVPNKRLKHSCSFLLFRHRRCCHTGPTVCSPAPSSAT